MKSRLFLLACLTLAPLSAGAQDDAPPPSAPSATYTETRLSALEEQMRVLNGRIEQVEFAVRRLDASLQRLQSDDDARLTHLESAQAAAVASPPPVVQPVAQPIAQPVAQPQNTVPLSQAPVPDVNGTLGALKVQGNKVVGGTNNPQAPPLPATPPDYGLTTQEQYERAFALLRQADYPDAEVAFKAFIDKNPKDKLIDSAKYWYGETLFVREHYDEAAVAFADAYQQNTQGPKAPDSLLKLGMSLAALNKIPDACVTLNELKAKYPNASAPIKTRAQDERARLKCAAH